MKKKILITASMVLVVLLVLQISFVCAFGVASNYWEGNPLQVYPGETETSILTLQNMRATEDLTIQVEITRGSEVASIERNQYLVRANTADTEVPVRVTIPAGTPINTKYKVTVSSKTVTPGGAGVVFGTAMDTTFDVLVIAKPAPKPERELAQEKPESNTFLIWGIVIILLLIIVAVIFMKKKKK